MSKKSKPRSRKDGIVVQELDGEVLIYDLRTDKAFSLNSSAALVWQACDGNKDISQIEKYVEQTLNAPGSEDLVWLALSQLKKDSLLDDAAEIPEQHYGMSRRQVIKKIGLGSMVALPIVASLVAPSPALATASRCGPLDLMNCTAPEPACPGFPLSFPKPAPGAWGPTATFASPTCTTGHPTCLCRGPWVCSDSNNVTGMCG